MERRRVALAALGRAARSGVVWVRFRAEKNAASDGVESLCDKASDHARVMLHLRPRYDSKAAILTIPAKSFAGRKSKSRLNSKGLDR
jgi:hypothetical protein